jgi:hypothetical protein
MGNGSNHMIKNKRQSTMLHSCYDYNNINIKCTNGKCVENKKNEDNFVSVMGQEVVFLLVRFQAGHVVFLI